MATETPNTARPTKDIFLEIKIKDSADPADAFAGHVSACTVTPSSSTVSWSGGTPDAQLSSTIAGPNTLAMNVAQDVENAASLWIFLRKNAGKIGVFTYGPHKDGVFRSTVEAEILPPMLGGPTNAFNESAYSIGCSVPEDTFPV